MRADTLESEIKDIAIARQIGDAAPTARCVVDRVADSILERFRPLGTRERPLADLKPNAADIERHKNRDSLRGSIGAQGLLNPICTLENGEIIAGTGRFLCCQDLGWATVECKVFPNDLTPLERKLIRWSENVHRTDLSTWDRVVQAQEVFESAPDLQAIDVAALLNISPGMVTRLRAAAKLEPVFQEALQGGILTLEDGYVVSRLPEKERFDFLAAKRNGATSGELARQIRRRKTKSSNGKQPKVSRAAIPLAGGGTLTISRKNLDMDGVCDVLASALDAARKAQLSSYSVKAWLAVLRDRPAGEVAS